MDRGKKLVSYWNQNVKLYEKASIIIGFICSILIIILGVITISGLISTAINIMELLLGVLMVTQGLLWWRRNKPIALFSLGVALFIFVVAILIL